MTSIVTKGRKSLASAALAIGITLTFASPAQAETVTLVCEGDLNQSIPWSDTFEIDYAASTVKSDGYTFRAVITDREIIHSRRSPNDTYVVKIDRLTGMMSSTSNESGPLYRGRCRAATTKKF